MAFSPAEWSVVLIGRWNRAILTPAGIGKRLLELPPNTPLAVGLPIDAIAPPQVKHSTFSIVAGSDKLIVQPTVCKFDLLDKARVIACRGITSLPETPVSAAGFNIRYSSSEIPFYIESLLDASWDASLSDNGMSILSRSIERSIKWGNGSINVSIIAEDDGCKIALNFDLQSEKSNDLKNWLDLPIQNVHDVAKTILYETMNIPEVEIQLEHSE